MISRTKGGIHIWHYHILKGGRVKKIKEKLMTKVHSGKWWDWGGRSQKVEKTGDVIYERPLKDERMSLSSTSYYTANLFLPPPYQRTAEACTKLCFDQVHSCNYTVNDMSKNTFNVCTYVNSALGGKVRQIWLLYKIMYSTKQTLFLFSNLSLTVDLTYDHNGWIILSNHYAYDSVCMYLYLI